MRRHPYIALSGALLSCFAVFMCLDLASVFKWFEVSSALCLPLAFAVAGLALAGLRRVLLDLFPDAPRTASRALILAAFAFVFFLGYGCAMDASHFFRQFFGCSIYALPWALCIALFGIALRLRRRLPRCLLRTLAALLALATLADLLHDWYQRSPLAERYRVTTVGDPPKTVVLSHAWCGWDDGPCDLRLFVRDDDSSRWWNAWVVGNWPYSSFDDIAVVFSPDGAPQARDAQQTQRACRPEELGTSCVGPITYGADGPSTFPPDFSPANLHAAHKLLCHP
jgi:hypothetical protein